MDFDHEPFRPTSSQHLLCGGIPTDFDAPVYAEGADLHPDDVTRGLLRRYPEPPKGLSRVEALAKNGLRPHNLLQPDAYVLGPATKAVIRGHVGPDWTDIVYPPAPLYRSDRTVALTASPTAQEMESDRQRAVEWAQEALHDPSTVILAVNAIGSPAPTAEPLTRATPYEVAITSATGRKRWHRLINPQWEAKYLQQINLNGATPSALEAAPTFGEVRDSLLSRIAGKRVVTYGRSMQYAALYTALEYAWLGDNLPEGSMFPDTATTLKKLARSRWQCARLRHAEFQNEWEPANGHYALPPLFRAGNALQHCRALSELMQQIAVPALRYAQLNATAEQAVRDGKSHLPRPLSGVRLSRISASRQAVLQRSGGACENPNCPDPRYTSARGRNGTYLLEVDHIDDHAKHGEDLPRSMIALCPNCHALKTRGTVTEEFRETLRATALTNHHRLMADAQQR